MKHATRYAFATLALALLSNEALAASATFGTSLSSNTTGLADSLFLGAPDGLDGNNGTAWSGIGGQVIVFDFEDIRIVDGVGGDFNVYEVDFGVQEFNAISVAVSEDGTNFFTLANVAPSRVAVVEVDNDPGHTDDVFARAYDIAASGFTSVRFVRIDGNGGAAAGSTTGFDLDAVGAVNFEQVPVPVPAAIWMLSSALAGLAFTRRKSSLAG